MEEVQTSKEVEIDWKGGLSHVNPRSERQDHESSNCPYFDAKRDKMRMIPAIAELGNAVETIRHFRCPFPAFSVRRGQDGLNTLPSRQSRMNPRNFSD
jgi:hypothetical protein